jgi:hypothetical protein
VLDETAAFGKTMMPASTSASVCLRAMKRIQLVSLLS